MSKLDPQSLFARLSTDIPRELHEHLFVIGSLAAAYHFSDQLQDQTLNTKDADLVVHPAGGVNSCRQMAERLLSLGWTIKEDRRFRPQPTAELLSLLPFIRLSPPESRDYFVEFLTLPEIGQREHYKIVPVELSDGWFAAPSFKFFVLLALHRQRSKEGLEYAAPSMMALANLLAHPQLGKQTIEGDGRLRSAKDLGRVIALARLAGMEEVENGKTSGLQAYKNVSRVIGMFWEQDWLQAF